MYDAINEKQLLLENKKKSEIKLLRMLIFKHKKKKSAAILTQCMKRILNPDEMGN